MNFVATKRNVSNRGVPPDGFLEELVDCFRKLPDTLFAPNERYDVYASVLHELGPWQGLTHRKAVMMEVLRVLAGFESAWNWEEGRDTTNATSDTPGTEEAGIFQVSANSMNFDPSLRQCVDDCLKHTDAPAFIAGMKAVHPLALEYAARLLRFTTRHNGPVLRKEINLWLSRAAVAEFEGFLA